MGTHIKKIPLELYIHIPFCIRKCAYCDFLSFPAGKEERSLYVEQLIREIEEAGAAFGEYQAETVFIGGGTPSVLEAGQTERIMDAVRKSFCMAEKTEITTEANPGTVTPEKLKIWKRSGISRISFGLQSARNRELEYLGRIHTMEDFLESFDQAREAGFENINVDLMSALPGQTEKDWEDTLKKTAALKPEHISAYSLIIEEGTPFFDRYGEDREKKKESGQSFPPLPDEDTERLMYYRTDEILKASGYHRYEISNYAKPGYECRHNKGYWTGTEYLGLGLGAASYVAGSREEKGRSCSGKAKWLEHSGMERFSNTKDMKRYMSFSREDFRRNIHRENRDPLTWKAQMEEFMFLGLRLTEGVTEQAFLERFGCSVREIYGSVVSESVREGLMEQTDNGKEQKGRAHKGGWRLTKKGIDVSNYVLSKFLLD